MSGASDPSRSLASGVPVENKANQLIHNVIVHALLEGPLVTTPGGSMVGCTPNTLRCFATDSRCQSTMDPGSALPGHRLRTAAAGAAHDDAHLEAWVEGAVASVHGSLG